MQTGQYVLFSGVIFQGKKIIRAHFRDSASSTMKCNTWGSRKEVAVLSVKSASNASLLIPYASWERGTNEHINGLVRWYLPKGTDFSKITEEQIAQIEAAINNRPRKCLGFKTPIEVVASSVALRS